MSVIFSQPICLYLDERIQSDQKQINWEFLDDKELTKQGETKRQ